MLEPRAAQRPSATLTLVASQSDAERQRLTLARQARRHRRLERLREAARAAANLVPLFRLTGFSRA
jgi:hypothetical protein